MKTMLMLAALALAGCTTDNRTRETLIDSGFTHIEVGGYDFLSCGKDDFYSTHFKARNPAGREVEGTVCCGFFKSCTVRF